ncbi:transcellular chaperone signaling (x)cross tissue [Caenorhabditis elegans]|uniref:Transcellular chaperone signaling (X)cross tissue n=1 Tax=Caenorhabditis elegans TaxID=6239 RepID=Q19616_CAEEL|nr:transcellular chaperone signaling (x)cross tissue [Caenorhabditis elegans]CCD66548.1 transcellular chaperone signaling (x)cross tissue [Caenorhabditis elegans]|eukprot:NP_504788.1 Uncharacterized protein CELE_F20A1.10 [Caenorhabditis elegans]
MCKLFVAVALLAVAIYAAPPVPPSAEEVKAQLVAAGLSETSAAGIVEVAEKYKTQLEALKDNKDDKEAIKKVFEEIKTDTDAYIKTQPEADQKAYATYIESKKKEFEGHHSTPAH